ncbi:MAG: hypothetical protein WBO06_12960 [Gammaproteobacteria bacterium]
MRTKFGNSSPIANRPVLVRLLAVLLLAAAGLPAATGNSESSPTRLEGDQYADPLAALKHFSALEDDEMATMRGGLRVAGVDIKFGVNLYTTVNGQVVLDSSYILTANGLEDTLPNTVASLDTATQTVSADMARENPVRVGGESGAALSDITPQDFDLSGLGDAEGVVINNDDGFTAVLHQITQDRIVSFLVTDSSNQNIENRVDVNITIENFTQYQGSVRDALLGGGISRAVGDATAPR